MRVPAFRLLWVTSFCAETAQWMLQIALPLFVLDRTGSALATSTVAVLGLLPSAVCTPMGGAIVDRYGRRPTMTVLAVAQAVLLIPLLLVPGRGGLWLVVLVAVAQGALNGVFESAKNTTMPMLVPDESLTTANAMVSVNSNLGRLLGGPVGGLVLAYTGIIGIVVGAGVAFAAVATVVSTMHIPDTASSTRAPAAWSGPVRGLRRVLATTELRAVALAWSLMSLAQGMFVLLFLLFVTGELHGGDPQVGLLRGVQALGGLVGGVVIGRLVARYSPATLVVGSLVTFGLISALTWNGPVVTTALPVYVGLFAVVGAPAIWIQAGVLTLAQVGTPDEEAGTVMGSLLALSDGAQALGIVAAGALAGSVPLIALLNVQAALFVLAAVLVAAVLGVFRRSRAVPAPETATTDEPERKAS